MYKQYLYIQMYIDFLIPSLYLTDKILLKGISGMVH